MQYLREAHANVVFIAIGRNNLYMSDEERKDEFEKLTPYVEFFKDNGLETGIWLDTFGFGGDVPDKYKAVAGDWLRVTDINGLDLGADFCSEGEELVKCCQNVFVMLPNI